MNVYIDDKELENLYVTGKSRKLKLRPDIIEKYFATIQKIDAARDIYDLWKDPSLNFEKYKKHYSMRLTGKYRLEMTINWMNEKNTVGEFHLFAITNHYRD
ncbi:MAG: type II toxin-antitoxin system RelE/ParE family toxin [Bacteroidales bacterium]|nr:type II toxin-antitoxin system RelE/ParE family toxin [Bacteroidales bacterium]